MSEKATKKDGKAVKKKKPMYHTGHRKRLRERFFKNGIDSLQEHEVLELLLFYAIPRSDTNPIAHELLDTYGSISGVLDAPIDALMEIDGLGECSAVFLKMLPSICRLYSEDKEKHAPKGLVPEMNLYDTLVSKFIDKLDEHVVLMLLSSSMKILYCDYICSGSIESATIDLKKIIKIALKFNSRFAILAHNHPSGIPMPSEDDKRTTKIIQNALSNIDVTLLDHVIVAGTTYASMCSGETNVSSIRSG